MYSHHVNPAPMQPLSLVTPGEASACACTAVLVDGNMDGCGCHHLWDTLQEDLYYVSQLGLGGVLINLQLAVQPAWAYVLYQWTIRFIRRKVT